MLALVASVEAANDTEEVVLTLSSFAYHLGICLCHAMLVEGNITRLVGAKKSWRPNKLYIGV